MSAVVVDHAVHLGGLLEGDRVNLIACGERLGAFAVVKAGAGEVSVALVPLATLEVRVDGCAGADVRLAPVWSERFPGSAFACDGGDSHAEPWGEPVDGDAYGETDERGRITFERVIPGNYQVWIDGQRRGDLLTIAPGARLSRTFVVPAR